MSNRTKGNARMRELIFQVIDGMEPGTVITSQEMCKIIEEKDSRMWPFPARVGNLIRMHDRIRHLHHGFMVLEAA